MRSFRKVFLLFISYMVILSCTSEGSTDKGKNDKPVTAKFYPVFTPIGGMYKNSVNVALTSEFPDAEIYYTLDGSKPSVKSLRYTGEIEVTESVVIRAVAVYNDKSYYSMSAFEIDNTSIQPDVSVHKSSPENNWADEIIYMVMLDRFNDGDKSNNDLGFNEYGNVEELYNGGDFKGISDRLDYIKNLGATAVWITPPVKNQYHDGNHAGYHGYWASDFLDTDPHYGSIEDYRKFVELAHSKGLRVIQDIVVNHIADFFKISDTGKYGDVSGRWSINEKSLPLKTPDRLPWTMNNPNLLTEDEYLRSSFYNWNPMIIDYNDSNQIKTFQVGDLDDLNTSSPVVRSLLRGYFRYWIDKVGIDGYRVDTVYYVEPDFFEDFVNSSESGNKGVRKFAADLGKNDFIVFGEAWHRDDEVCASYTKGSKGQERMDSLIYFPLNLALRDVAAGERTTLVSDVLNKRYSVGYLNPDKLVTFVDNHDMERLLNRTSPEMVKAAHMIIMTIPGIPQIYYGSEQGFKVTRRAMFKGGFKDHGSVNSYDHFDESGEWWDFYRQLIDMRKSNQVLRYNNLTIVKDTSNGAGILSYRLAGKDSSGNELSGIDNEALVVMNTSGSSRTFHSSTGFKAGDKLVLISPSVNLGDLKEIVVGKDGFISHVIPPQSAGVYLLKEAGVSYGEVEYSIEIETKFNEPVYNSITLSGKVNAFSYPVNITILVDDNEDLPVGEITAESGVWSGDVDISSLSNGSRTLRAKIKGTNVYSSSVNFEYMRPFELVKEISDPAGDDTGPAGFNYKMPTDVTFAGGLQDIKNVRVYTSGTDIKIELTMNAVTRVWKPTVNQFDHVMFSIFLGKPDSDKAVSYQPLHNYTLPDGFKWDYMFKAEGWSTVGFSSNGALPDKNGTPVAPVPSSSVNWDNAGETTKSNGVITFTISSQSIGRPDSLSGWKLYVNTWDIDMGKLRQIFPEEKQYSFGGGEMNKDPLVIDEISVITIP